MPSNNFLTAAKNVLRIAIPLAVGIFLGWQIYINWQRVVPTLIHANYTLLILAFFINLLLYPLWLFGWFLILRALGQKISFGQAFRVGVLANFAKYIPGVVWQYMGRVELAHKEGVPRPVGFASLVYEILIYLIAGGLWALLVFGTRFWIIGLVGSVASWFALPYIFKVLRKRFARLHTLPEVTIPLKTTLLVLIVNIFDFLVTGYALWFIMKSLGGEPITPIDFTAIYAFSWIVGYVTFLAPGGLGVADLTLTGLLAPFFGIGLSSLIAIMLRIIIFGNELLLGGLILLLWRKQK